MMANGGDQNSGVIELNSINGNTDGAQQACLEACQSYPRATGCEVIWDQSNRGCYVHTQSIARGNGKSRHQCWVFSSCVPHDQGSMAASEFPTITLGGAGGPTVLSWASLDTLTVQQEGSVSSSHSMSFVDNGGELWSAGSVGLQLRVQHYGNYLTVQTRLAANEDHPQQWKLLHTDRVANISLGCGNSVLAVHSVLYGKYIL